MRWLSAMVLSMISGLSLFCSAVQAQADVLVEAHTGRTANGAPVAIRAILVNPPPKVEAVLLYFRGMPGYARIESVASKQGNYIGFLRQTEARLREQGVAIVLMDCPADQWGETGRPFATSCLDDYRSSRQHADDVRLVMARLRETHGVSKFFLMGHSLGTLSSRWLALHLGSEIAGSIHSASVNVPNGQGHYQSARRIRYDEIRTPILHIHNEADACPGTPYALVRNYAGDRLTTVSGGIPAGPPCGAGHFHSYQGVEEAVARTVVNWIATGKVEATAGP